MHFRDVMSRDVETIRSTVTAKAAAERVGTNGIVYLPVSDQGKPVGIVTDCVPHRGQGSRL